MERILRSPFHPLLSRGVLLLTLRGRHTGATITLPVMYARCGPDVIVWAENAGRKRWWRNLEDGAEVSLTVRGRPVPARAVVLADEPARGDALRAYVERFPRARRRIAATDVLVRLSPSRGSTPEAVNALAASRRLA